jgi:hypothetical protein
MTTWLGWSSFGSTMTAKHFQDLAKEQMVRASSAPVQLAFWADARRGAPNAFLRAAMFCAGKPTKARKNFKAHALEVMGPYTITYTGPQLYQPELDVWLQLVHLCRLRPLGNETQFQVGSFLRSLRHKTGKSDYEWLIDSLMTLRATAIRVEWKDKSGQALGYIGGLVDSLGFDKTMGRWSVRLDPRIAKLFAPTEHTWLQASARLALGRGYLAKWLHGYFSTHERPHPISVQRLLDLSGSTAGRLRKFRENLRVALAEVARVETAEGRRFEWRIDDEDLVHVRRDD